MKPVSMILAWPVAMLVGSAGALAQPTAPGAALAQPPTRGQLLYNTHCIACHSTAMHWRDQRLATDWPSLKAWVERWQSRVLLNWTEADIVEVTRHLNDAIYRFARPAG
ncbi:cytochrome C [Ideonella sp. A 288]|uniref:cytochrome C n=1 Tax=Ideonella sp. A 288 TaxID=1962181 RepID=UPI001F198A34|nr:cytochrome C [Ideonella sp. A 288]